MKKQNRLIEIQIPASATLEVEVTDLQGKQVYSSKQVQRFELNDVQPGIYVLSIGVNGKFSSSKILLH